MPTNPLHQRRAGVLLHPSSLPSGLLDNNIERWLDWLAGCDFSIWQMLPLVIPDHTGSPYQSCSAFALNPGLSNTLQPLRDADRPVLDDFRKSQSSWLDDFALFYAIREHHDNQRWDQWPAPLSHREPAAIEAFRQSNANEIDEIAWQQCQLHERWQNIQQAAHERGIYLFGDMPIFVAYDSADVWANREQFLLDDDMQPTYVAGVPPDYFSETGQRWGNPQYDWEHMTQDNFSWWQSRICHMLQLFDIVRIDHFRGLQASWMIPAEAETAIEGDWVETPGDALLHALQAHIADLPIVAEDLGVITPEVTALREKYDLPGMCVLQFAFDAFDDNPHKPNNIKPNNVVYTGTHDNDTTVGWFTALEPNEQAFVFDVLDKPATDDIADCMIEIGLNTRANTVIVPLQDVLGLGSDSRMNLPGASEGNWNWRFDWAQMDHANCDKIAQWIRESGRHHVD